MTPACETRPRWRSRAAAASPKRGLSSPRARPAWGVRTTTTAWLRRSRRRFDALSAEAFPGDGDDPATRALEVAWATRRRGGRCRALGTRLLGRATRACTSRRELKKLLMRSSAPRTRGLRLAVARVILYQEDCRVLSLGGGPGGDYAALATLADYAGGDYLDNRPAPSATSGRRRSALRRRGLRGGWAACVEALASVAGRA